MNKKRASICGKIKVSNLKIPTKGALYEYCKHLTIRKDSTLLDTYGHQEGEGFNFHYQSHGYHPLVCYDGMTGDLLKIELRNGTDYSATGVVEFL